MRTTNQQRTRAYFGDRPADTLENYREYIRIRCGLSKSRGNSRYFNRLLNEAKSEAAYYFPKGAAIANKKDSEFWYRIIAIGLFIVAALASMK